MDKLKLLRALNSSLKNMNEYNILDRNKREIWSEFPKITGKIELDERSFLYKVNQTDNSILQKLLLV